MMTKGLLLINLGSPSAPEPREVRKYLNQFLTDPHVIDIPWSLRQILVRGFISPTRSVTTAAAYKVIWTEEGSPLVQFTKRFAEKVGRELQGQFEVRWGMRYGSPSIQDTIKNWNVDEITLVPLYPQYAESSSRTCIEEVTKHLSKNIKLRIVKDFFAAPEFIESEAKVVQEHLDEFKPDHLLLSFHGLPEHHLKKLYPSHCLKSADCCAYIGEHNRFCYRAQCFSTANLIKRSLSFDNTKISIGFQSRLGRRPWIKPFTDCIVSDLANKGVKRLSVVCPSFIADCLETLEEIQVRLKEQFLREGGIDLRLIPCLNDNDQWVANFTKMLKNFPADL